MKSLFATIIVAMALFGCTEKQQPQNQVADPAAGKKIAENSCKGCHGLDGKGATDDIPNLAAQVQAYLVAAIDAYKEGKREHAALKDMMGKLSDAQIVNVAAYYSGLPPVTGQEKPAQDIAEKGKATASACAKCHGEGGNSTTAGIPNLAGQQPGYFISAVKDYREGRRQMSSDEKHQMMSALEQVDVEAMALYFASQKPAKRKQPSFGDVKAGEPLSANCGGCHGAGGLSRDSDIPVLASQDPQYLVEAIKAYKKNTREQEDMHQFLTNISDEGIENIAAYYAVQPAQPAEAGTISMKELADKCDHCHGPGKENPMMIIPKIRGQNKAYLVKALKAYHDNKRGSSPMHKMSLPYSEAVIESIATWYASQPPR
ncbi:MAG: c-type cytochrome [Gammaproteobacteria bacterium]|jgi:cytochrome c553